MNLVTFLFGKKRKSKKSSTTKKQLIKKCIRLKIKVTRKIGKRRVYKSTKTLKKLLSKKLRSLKKRKTRFGVVPKVVPSKKVVSKDLTYLRWSDSSEASRPISTISEHKPGNIISGDLKYTPFERLSNNPRKPGDKVGLIIVDVVSGFTTPSLLRENSSFGYKEYVNKFNITNPKKEFNLSPFTPTAIKRCDDMINNIKNLLDNVSENTPILTFVDAHRERQNEHPFPEHCIKGSEESLLDMRLYNILDKLKNKERIKCFEKDCFNGLIAGFGKNLGSSDNELKDFGYNLKIKPNKFGSTCKPCGKSRFGSTKYNGNTILKWCVDNKITHVIVTGICTDICVMHVVHALINTIQHSGALDEGTDNTEFKLRRVNVYEPGTASYDLPARGKPWNHPIKPWHDMAIKFMETSGARIINKPNNW